MLLTIPVGLRWFEFIQPHQCARVRRGNWDVLLYMLVSTMFLINDVGRDYSPQEEHIKLEILAKEKKWHIRSDPNTITPHCSVLRPPNI